MGPATGALEGFCLDRQSGVPAGLLGANDDELMKWRAGMLLAPREGATGATAVAASAPQGPRECGSGAECATDAVATVDGAGPVSTAVAAESTGAGGVSTAPEEEPADGALVAGAAEPATGEEANANYTADVREEKREAKSSEQKPVRKTAKSEKCTQYLTGTRIVASSCANIHSFALADDGLLFGWGCGSDGRLGLPNFFGPNRQKRLIKCYVSTPTGSRFPSGVLWRA